MFNELFQKLKDALGGSAADAPPPTPKINERMSRITAGEPFAGPKQRLQNLTGGSKSLTPDQIRAVRHEATRQKQETQAEAVLDKVRVKFGRLKLEQLAALPRVFEPKAVDAFRKMFTQVSDEDFAILAETIPRLDRDVCDDLARVTSWGPAEREKLKMAVAEPQRARLGEGTAAILEKLPELVREGVLRLPRVPSAKALEAQVAQYKTLPSDEVRAAAHALAHFGAADLPAVLKPPEVKAAAKAKAAAAAKKPLR